jgi:protein-tyrosine phosphatase
MINKDKMSVLFVCLGNICRSPTAQAVFTHKIHEAGVQDAILVDSAGTAGYHTGEAPDDRACEFAARRGYLMSELRARKVCVEDFDRFDFIIAMDYANLNNLQQLKPENTKAQVKLMLSYVNSVTEEVPDPYYGGNQGFDTVLDLLEDASDALLDSLQLSVK